MEVRKELIYKILNSPFFIVGAVSFYSIVSLFAALFFDSSSAFEYYTKAIKTKVILESTIAAFCGLLYGIDNKKSKSGKYFVFLFLCFFILHFFTACILILKAGMSDVFLAATIKENFNIDVCIAFSILCTFSFYISYFIIFDFKDIFNSIKNKNQQNDFFDKILKILNTPFSIATIIFYLSVIIAAYKAHIEGVDILSTEIYKSHVFAPVLSIVFGIIYGIYFKKAPRARFLFTLFALFEFYAFLTVMFLCKSLSLDDLQAEFYFPLVYILLFYTGVYICNFKKFNNENAIEIKKKIKNKSENTNENEIKIIHTPLKTAFYITLAGNICFLLGWIMAALLQKNSILISSYRITYFLDYIIAFSFGIYYGLKQIKVFITMYAIKMLIVCILIVVIRNFLFAAQLGVNFLTVIFIISSPIMASWVIGAFVITNYITYGIKNRWKVD